MFGYLRLPEKLLSAEEQTLYRSVYCGICAAVKRLYSNAERFLLPYDAIFPALLWLGLSEEPLKTENRTCAASVFKTHPVGVDHPALDAAAHAALWTGMRKLEDDALDGEHGMKTVRKIYADAARISDEHFPKSSAMEGKAALKTLHDLEKEGCSRLDAVAFASGRLTAAVFTSGPIPEEHRETVSELGLEMGRWVYLADAVDDLEKDRKSGSYNCLLAMGGEEEALDAAEDAMGYAAQRAEALLDMLPLKEPYAKLLKKYYELTLPVTAVKLRERRTK